METTAQQNFTPLEQDDVETKALSVPEQAKSILITDDESFQRAGHLLNVIKDISKEIDATFDPIIKKAHESHKEACNQKKRVAAPLLEAEAIIKPRMSAYHQQIENKRREEERRLQEEARKAEEERKLQEAVAAEKDGYQEEAEAIISSPVMVPRVVAPTVTPKLAGVAFRETWKAEVTDIRALARAVVEGKVSANSLLANDSFLNAQARSLKNEMNIPGVRVFKDTNVAGGGRR